MDFEILIMTFYIF